MKFKVLITTSGVGARFGELSKYTNKCLVKLGDKPAISYIIESYPQDTDYIITIGNFGNHVKDFLELAYPKRKFTFVTVDKYDGPGSSLVYSMLQAKKYLQCPFIYHSSESIVTETIPTPSQNWCGGHNSSGSSLYRSFDVLDNKIQHFYEKGAIDPDYIHIGIIGINNYNLFWTSLENINLKSSQDLNLSDVHVLIEMLNSNEKIYLKNFTQWYDVGKVDNLIKIKQHFKSKNIVLEKNDESIYFFSKFVIKFFTNPEIVQKRVKRAKLLKNLTPKIESYKNNFYRYKYVDGELLSDVINTKSIIELLKWAESKLWIKPKINIKNFSDYCSDFYFKKTQDRLKIFYSTRKIIDTSNIINSIKIPKLSVILSLVDKKRICNATPTLFHGDFILDNILKVDNGFCLIDWRQDFAGLLKAGDKYYDIAKLSKGMFNININGKIIDIDIYRRQKLIDCQNTLLNYLKTNDYDLIKVNILTSIIWLNMSALHEHPLDIFLYYFGKYNLWINLLKYND